MSTTTLSFKDLIAQGIPETLPEPYIYNTEDNHAPVRKQILSAQEKQLALKNALRYFPKEWHEVLGCRIPV
jgi:urocanate hydratase